MSAAAYIDTSAFIKRFLEEIGTREIEEFSTTTEHRLAISSLTVTEFRSIMKRLLRENRVTERFVHAATGQLLTEVASGALRFHAVDAATFNLAGELIDSLSAPLGTLDALHLASARATGAHLMVSCDKQLLRAAAEAGMDVLDVTAPKAHRMTAFPEHPDA